MLVILFLKAYFGLFVYDILAIFRPFKSFHSTVKRWKVSNKAANQDIIDRVCTAVNYACVWYPKQALCLQRSFVTTNGLGSPETPFQGACVGGSKWTGRQ
jgi:hypothetical protein